MRVSQLLVVPIASFPVMPPLREKRTDDRRATLARLIRGRSGCRIVGAAVSGLQIHRSTTVDARSGGIFPRRRLLFPRKARDAQPDESTIGDSMGARSTAFSAFPLLAKDRFRLCENDALAEDAHHRCIQRYQGWQSECIVSANQKGISVQV